MFDWCNMQGSRFGLGVEAVLLDAAGTLIQPREPVGKTYAAIAKRYGAALELDRLAQAFVEVFGEMPALAFEWTSMDGLHEQEREWWRLLVSRVVTRAGGLVVDFDGFFEALYGYYARGEAWECFPEVPAVLDELRARGCKLAVVSNFDSRLPGILEALGMVDRLDAVIYSSAAGFAKPEPAIFRQALEILAVTPRHAIHIGDNETADLRGAASAGIDALLVRRKQPQEAVDARVISSLDVLPLLVDRRAG